MTNKCPHCSSENEVDVSGYYQCLACNKWYSENDEPVKKKKSSLTKDNFLDDEEAGYDQNIFKDKGYKR